MNLVLMQGKKENDERNRRREEKRRRKDQKMAFESFETTFVCVISEELL